tara:strand:+ start:54 stop:296 length:243 start_codon:yes stop_codon:yes gene_type:complete
MGEWISVKDRLPDDCSEVLVICKWDNSPLIAFNDGMDWIEKCDNLEIIGDSDYNTIIHEVGAENIGYEITHWMPLPELPK